MSRGGKKHKKKATVTTSMTDAMTAAVTRDVTAAVTADVTSAVTTTVAADVTAALSKKVAQAVEEAIEKAVKESVEATVKVVVAAAVKAAVPAAVKAAMTAAGALPLLSLSDENVVEQGYNNTKVYALCYITKDALRSSWMEIDPQYSGPLKDADENHQDCFAIDRRPLKMNPPPHIDLCRITEFSTIVADSKVYFIGGHYINENVPAYGHDIVCVHSDKIFIYHLNSNKWEESPSRLNVARSSPNVAVVDTDARKFIYVFGDYSRNGPLQGSGISKEHWVEYCDLGNSDLVWELLPPSGAPPDSVLDDKYHKCHFFYQHGNQVVFFNRRRYCGFHSFDYVSKTWALFNMNLNRNDVGYNAVVIDHLLFWHNGQYIHAYDPTKNQLVLKQRLNELKMSFPTSGDKDSWLVSLGNDTLLLIACDHDDVTETLHLYKFQIVKLSSLSSDANEQNSCSIRLVQIGTGLFPPAFLEDVVLA